MNGFPDHQFCFDLPLLVLCFGSNSSSGWRFMDFTLHIVHDILVFQFEIQYHLPSMEVIIPSQFVILLEAIVCGTHFPLR